MKARMLILLTISLLVSRLAYSTGTLCRAVGQVVDLCETSKWCAVVNVDDTGYDREIYTNTLFLSSVGIFSNDWQSITNEWPAMRDNYEMRVVISNMAGFSGTNAFLGFLGVVVDDARTNAVSRKVVVDTLMASRTPLWMFVPDHYDLPCVSNLLERVIPLFPGDEQRQQHYRSVLSGEYKRHLDEERACGAIEY